MLVNPTIGTPLCAPKLSPQVHPKEAGSSSTKQSSIGLPIQVLSEEAKDEYRRACEQELEDLMFTGALATEPPESRGVIKGNQIWVVFPNNELVAVEINSSAHLAQLLHLASQLSTTIGPIHDVYATRNGKARNPNIPLVDQGIGEGSYVRVHYRLRGGAPKRGRQERHSFVEGRCIYGARCIYKHDPNPDQRKLCGNPDHAAAQRIYYGGGSYDPNLDPMVLREAERAAARNKTPPWQTRLAEPDHPPPFSVWPKYHSWSEVSDKQRSIWYCDDEEDVLVEEEPPKPKRDKFPSPPKIRENVRLHHRGLEGKCLIPGSKCHRLR